MDPRLTAPLLHEMAAQLNLDADTETTALRFLEEGTRADDPTQLKTYVRCAIMLASKTTRVPTLAGDSVPSNYVSVPQLLRSPSAPRLQEFIPELLSFSERVSVADSVREEIVTLTHRYAFSLKFFEKFEEMWIALGAEDDTSQEVAWLLFLVARQQLAPESSDVIEITNLLIAVVDFVGKLLPGVEKSLEGLCSMVKTKSSAVQPVRASLEALLADMRARDLLRCSSSSEGLLASAHIHYNLARLNQEYDRNLRSIDERDFITNCHKVGTPLKQVRVLTPFAKHSARLPSQRVIQWEETQTEWQDFSAKTVLSSVATPVTMAMEMNNWLHDLVETVDMNGALPRSISDSEARTLMADLGQTLSDKFSAASIGTMAMKDLTFFEQHFSDLRDSVTVMRQEYLFGNSKVDLIFRFAAVALQKAPELTPTVLKGTVSCAVETVFFLHNITALDFEEVLKVCDCDPVDLWQALAGFMDIDPRVPLALKQHLRRIEAKVVNALAWKSSYPRPSLPASFQQRVLSQAAQRTQSLCECLQLPDETREAVWSAVSYILSSCPDLLRDRHLDQILLCTVYGCCKLRSQVSFKRINEAYSRLNPEEARELTQRVQLRTGFSDNIIGFYNKVFLPKMKAFLTGETNARPLASTSPLNTLLPVTLAVPCTLSPRSPLTSPIMTPRTLMLYAPRETPVKTADPTRVHSHRVLDYDCEDKHTLPAHLIHILSPVSSLPFELPQLKSEEKRVM